MPFIMPYSINLNLKKHMNMKTTKYIISVALALTCALGNLFAVDKSYYTSVNGKSGKDLFDAVHAVAKTGYSGLTYAQLWTAYCAIDINSSGYVWDMYSNTTSYTCGGSVQGANFSAEGDAYNREHSIPKSWFNMSDPNSNPASPGTDLFHVVPTDGYVNNMRSNQAFGEVSVPSYTSQSGCKKGAPKSITISNSILNSSGSTSTTCSTTPVFEPMDEYKGDFARGYMGTMTMWAGDYVTFTTGAGGSIFNTSYDAAHYYGLTEYGVALLMKWHREDPVSAKEIARNNGIQNQQGNRNPFIDYPELAEYLWGNKAGQTVVLDALTPTFTLPCSGKLGTPSVTATPDDGQITLVWEDVTDATGYTVTIGAGSGYTTECANPSVGTITHSGTTNTCVITGLVNGLSYTTFVVAKGETICDSDPDEDTTMPVVPVTVTFHKNDGSSTTTTQTIPYNTPTALDANPFGRTGYTFQGWATTASGAKAYDDQQSVTLTGDLNLYAVWQKNSHHVIFTPSPTGATVTINGQSASPQSVEYGETVTISVTPDDAYAIESITATGVTLSGSGNTRTYTMPDADVTVTVNMTQKPTFAIRFFNNGEQVGTTQNLYAGATAVKPTPDPTVCEGYTFVGWWTTTLSETNTTTHTWVTDFTVTGAQDYYAVYKHNEGGSGSSTVTFTPGTDTGASSITKDGVTCSMSKMDNASYYQIYASSTGTFSVASGNITSIAITCTASGSSKYGPGNITADPSGYTYSGTSGTWSGSASSVSFTGSQQVRMTSIVVTVGGGGTTYYTTSADCTPQTPRTFTFDAGTGICATTSLTEDVWNAGVTLPVATGNSGCDPEYMFAGWATAPVEETSTAPTLYSAGSTYNGAATTLYAVYSQTTGGSGSGFTLSCTMDEVTYYAAARSGTNKYMGATTNAADAARFSIVTSNNEKYLCWLGAENTYVSNNANKADLLFSTDIDNAYAWEVTETETTIILEASNGRRFLINNSLKDRFAAYSREEVLTKGGAGTMVYNSNPSCVCLSVDITYNANGGTLADGCENVAGGDCERDWMLCDAPTRDGYVFTNWKDQNDNLYNAGATVSELKTSLTLTAQWIEAPYTVLFNAGTGTSVASVTEASRGDGITLPKADPSAACAEDWTFVGWSATELVGETNTSATIVGNAGIPYIPTANNTTLYAVYSRLDESGASNDYTRATTNTPAEGDYVLVLAKSDDAFGILTYGTTSKGKLAFTSAYSSLPAKITSPAAAQIWHLSYDASGYANLYNANAGAYLAASGTNVTFSANAGSAFVFTKDAGSYGDFECLNNTASSTSNYYLGANKDADYIRYYASQTLVALNSITLYKGSTGTLYYSTSPACTPCEDPEWSFELGTSVVKTRGSEPFTNTVIKVHESAGTVTYSSTDESVATVDATGLVTMYEPGTTTITLRLTKAMPYCAAVMQYELEVKEPSIEIVNVTPNGEIVLEHDLEGTISLDLSEGNAVSTGTAANDLFFSKYFEAASNMKLFAIFNGTGHDVDLTNIRVRCNCSKDGIGVWASGTGKLGYVELRTISKLREQYPKLKIPTGTELIFWSNNKGGSNESLRECISFSIGDMTYHYSEMEAMEIPNWFCLGDYDEYDHLDADGNNQFVFNGDDSMILERYNPVTGKWEAIDLFGAGTSEAPASTEGLVENIATQYLINGTMQRLNDGKGFHAECTGNPIPLSTNRYMLVRKSTVLDGLHAVEANTTSFATLCEEWDGTPVGGSASAYCYSGEIFSDIAEYDYAENYIDWDDIEDNKYDVDINEDGTVSITFHDPDNLDTRACTLLKIVVRDKNDDTKILATTEYKIPIVVKAGEVLTSADLFHDQADKCATCDVVILGSAILTKATDGATNDMPEVRDIYVYGGGKLVIPSGTHYKARDLVLRMQTADDKINVDVPNVRVDGSLTNQYGGAIRQQARFGTNRFYQFAVPYPVRLEDVTFSDGTPAVYGEDFMIRYYDGEQRAANQGTASNWRNFGGTQLLPGVGYTLAIAKKAGHDQRELVFPLDEASLIDGEPATKQTTIHAWGDNSLRANHRGWNFLSNPYLTTYAKNHLDEDAGGMLTTGKLIPDPEHPGWWVNDEGTVPYVTLINSSRTDYTQELVALKELPPFTTFFIQAGDDTHNSGAEFSLIFDKTHRKTSAPAYFRAEPKTAVTRFGVLLSGNNAEDNCGMAIGEKYSAAYDMQADLSKEFGSAYSLKLYTLQEDQMQMAFLATHPDSLNKPVPVGVRLPADAEYTFAIDRRYNLGAFEHIYLTDNVTGRHTDLLEDTYSFTGTRSQNDTRFSLSVQLRQDIITGTDNLLHGIYAVGRDGFVMLTGLPETATIYIYDMNGRLVLNRHTHGATSVTYSMPTGVYQIRIQSEGANALLRTIVH